MPAPIGARLHPLHAILLAFPLALFTAALVTDIAYLKSAEIQWSNFSSWLLAGALFMGGLTLLWAAITLLLARRTRYVRRLLVFFGLLAVAWMVGFINALLHSRDAWVSVTTTGAVLSGIAAALTLIAAWIGFSSSSRTEVI